SRIPTRRSGVPASCSRAARGAISCRSRSGRRDGAYPSRRGAPAATRLSSELAGIAGLFRLSRCKGATIDSPKARGAFASPLDRLTYLVEPIEREYPLGSSERNFNDVEPELRIAGVAGRRPVHPSGTPLSGGSKPRRRETRYK